MNPTLLLELQQTGIDCTFVQLKYVFAHLLEAARKTESVKRAQGVECFQDHKIERALQDFRSLVFDASSFGLAFKGVRPGVRPLSCPP